MRLILPAMRPPLTDVTPEASWCALPQNMSSAQPLAWGTGTTPLYIQVDVLIPQLNLNKREMKAPILPHGRTAASHPKPTPITAGTTWPAPCALAIPAPVRRVCSALFNNGLEECLRLNISGQTNLQNRSEVPSLYSRSYPCIFILWNKIR